MIYFAASDLTYCFYMLCLFVILFQISLNF